LSKSSKSLEFSASVDCSIKGDGLGPLCGDGVEEAYA
jgi:hypothetical protein